MLSELLILMSSDITTSGPDYTTIQRNLALELVRVTEAAALASALWFGKGDKNAADQAAVDMMRKVLNTIQMDGVIVIGEGARCINICNHPGYACHSCILLKLPTQIRIFLCSH